MGSKPEDVFDKDGKIEFISLKDFEKAADSYPHGEALKKSMGHVHYCKMETFGKCMIGTFSIPDKRDILGKKQKFGCCLTKEKVMFVGEAEILTQMKGREADEGKDRTVGAFLAVLLMELTAYDGISLEKMEERLMGIEDSLLKANRVPDRFFEKILKYRKELMTLHSYYEQLIDVGENLQADTGGIFQPEEQNVFGTFASRAGRLHDHVDFLREYLNQLREMYQNKIDLEQNKNMNMLTIVTTLFLPLSILVGWYGMNFTNMPELKWPYGYTVIVVVSICIIVLEIIIFKKKKML
ncbi:CorA family divalent cation transporter [Clostridium sp. AM58-1XD]|uniref:magnesium transporter CorA family protein n=1 Tax=Clostridium sp. AM58-1XD TaxID=2292307 RepID=UPI000E548250|nr:CorA family divalent cation transporter [Clostridium sp. AM58-1XD]RGY98439.1 hypothetical protein DXA13_11640 [Clostridium sp. AM58-1XD]